MQMSMFSLEEHPANPSASQACEKDWMTRVATSCLPLVRLLQNIAPHGWCGKVPGVLSSNGGRDFGTFLGMLGQLGYGFAYRVLDAQYFGVAQRRRRVFVVGCLGDWRSAAAVLFERHSLQGHPAPRREAGKAAPTIPSRSTGGGGLGTDFDCDGGLIPTTVGAMVHQAHGGIDTQSALSGYIQPVRVSHSLRGEGYDASEDGTGRGTPLVPVAIQERAVCENPDAGPDGAGFRTDGAAYTLEARTTAQAVAFAQNQRDEVRQMSVSGALSAEPGAKQQTYVAFDLRGREGGAMPEGPHDTAAIRAASGGSSRSYIAQLLPVAWSIMPQNSGKDYKAREVQVAQPIMAGGPVGGNQGGDYIQQAYAVRRLTPTECERLQGFPSVKSENRITVWSTEQQRNDAIAEMKSRKSQRRASSADGNKSRPPAKTAKRNSSINPQGHERHAALIVHINLERGEVVISRAGKFLFRASIAEEQGASHLPIPTGDFVQLTALMRQIVARTTPNGKVELLPSTKHSLIQENGKKHAHVSGQEIEELAKDADRFTSMVKECLKFTTSEAGQTSQDFDTILKTWSCCVAHAISGFIPEITKGSSSFELLVTAEAGYTAIPWRNKPAEQCPDGPRYKALGNSMAVPVMRWIGERINQVAVIKKAEAA